jgi:hypothetical protein
MISCTMQASPHHLSSEIVPQPLMLLRTYPTAHHGLWGGSQSVHMIHLQQKYKNNVSGAREPLRTVTMDQNIH